MADMTAPIVLLSEQQQQWLDSATENHWLRRIDFQDISQLQMGVASGGFGIVHAGKWRGMPVAIKVLFSLADFIQEVQIHRAVQDFENVVKFFGVTRMRGNGDYGMVLQFAGRGSLRDYLSKHYDKLDWTKKLRLARDVASGINFIHLENICHHDLHSRNVLIDDKGRALITDFGLSRYLNKDHSNNGVRGVVPYISPERLKNAPFDKSSDIYSLGVIMWELTSGYPPFDRDGENFMLAFHITKGTREKVIPGTPVEYADLYQKCWDGEPSNRPPLVYILDTLDNLLALRTGGGSGEGSSQRPVYVSSGEDAHGPPHSLPTVTQTAVVSSEPMRKSAPIASKLHAIDTTFEGHFAKPVANISPLVPKHSVSRNHLPVATNPDGDNTVDFADRFQGLRMNEDAAERPAGQPVTPARPAWMHSSGMSNGGMGARHIHPNSPKLPITPPQQSPVKTTPRMNHALVDPSGARLSPKNVHISPTIPELGGGGNADSIPEMGSPAPVPMSPLPMPQPRLHQFYPQQQHPNQFNQHPVFPQLYPPQAQQQSMYPPQQQQQQQQQQQHQQYPHQYPPYPYPSNGHARQAHPDPSYPGYTPVNNPGQTHPPTSIPPTIAPARNNTAGSSGRVNSNNNWIPLDGKTRIREFFMASLKKVLDAVQWHLDHGADVMERYEGMSGRTPLHAAAVSNSLEVMTLLCEAAGSKLNLNEEDDTGQTPLHLMTHYGTNDSYPLLDYMLEKGANPNAQDSERRTPLMTALTLNDNGQLVETLLDYGADPTIMFLNNNALAEAAIRLRYECVKVLLETDLSMSEPQSLDHAIDGCYRLTDTKNQNRGLILNLLVRWRNNAEGIQRRRTLATLIATRSMQLGPRRINRQRLARQVLESSENLHHHGRCTP